MVREHRRSRVGNSALDLAAASRQPPRGMAVPTVFLSAASIDLKEWRDVLHGAFSRAGFGVLTQEQSLRAGG